MIKMLELDIKYFGETKVVSEKIAQSDETLKTWQHTKKSNLGKSITNEE